MPSSRPNPLAKSGIRSLAAVGERLTQGISCSYENRTEGLPHPVFCPAMSGGSGPGHRACGSQHRLVRRTGRLHLQLHARERVEQHARHPPEYRAGPIDVAIQDDGRTCRHFDVHTRAPMLAVQRDPHGVGAGHNCGPQGTRERDGACRLAIDGHPEATEARVTDPLILVDDLDAPDGLGVFLVASHARNRTGELGDPGLIQVP